MARQRLDDPKICFMWLYVYLILFLTHKVGPERTFRLQEIILLNKNTLSDFTGLLLIFRCTLEVHPAAKKQIIPRIDVIKTREADIPGRGNRAISQYPLTWWWHGYRHKVPVWLPIIKTSVRFLCCGTEKVVRGGPRWAAQTCWNNYISEFFLVYVHEGRGSTCRCWKKYRAIY